MDILKKIEISLTESNKMRTKNGFEHTITIVKKVQKYADSIGLTDSRLMAGNILDWCKLNKVKIGDVIKKSANDEETLSLAKKVFVGGDMRKNTPSSTQLKSLFDK